MCDVRCTENIVAHIEGFLLRQGLGHVGGTMCAARRKTKLSRRGKTTTPEVSLHFALQTSRGHKRHRSIINFISLALEVFQIKLEN